MWDASHYFPGYYVVPVVFQLVVMRMQYDTDFELDDEQVYNNYISSLSFGKALSNYIQARTYEPAVMVGYGMLLVAKTPAYMVVPGVASRSWKRYLMVFKCAGMRCEITRKELYLKIKHMFK